MRLSEISVLIVLITCAYTPLRVNGKGGLPPHYFSHIRVSEGLSHNKVNSIIKDQRGFLWFGTEDGLTRYDGHYFTIFRTDPSEKTAISGNIINDLFEDESGILWIATTDGGISRYDYRLPESRQFKQFKHVSNQAESIPDNHIRKIVADRYGSLWLISGNKGLIRFCKAAERFDQPIDLERGNVASLALDGRDTLWISKEDGTVFGVNTRTLAVTIKRHHLSNGRKTKASKGVLYIDRRIQMQYDCFGAKPDLMKKGEKPSGNLINGHGLDEVDAEKLSALAVDAANRLWVGYAGDGIAVYDRYFRQLFRYRSQVNTIGSLVDDRINTVYIDRDNIVWIGTDNGISIFNGLFQPFKRYELADSQKPLTIYDFFKDGADRLWIGTSDGVFIRKPGDTVHEHRRLYYNGQALAVTKFFLDTDSSFYLGTNYTLFRYDAERNILSTLPNTEDDAVMRKLTNTSIVSISRTFIDGKSVLLVSPYGQYLAYYDFEKQRWISGIEPQSKLLQRLNIKDNFIQKLYQDGSGLWLATNKSGLAVSRGPSGSPLKYFDNESIDQHGLGSNYVYDIIGNNINNLWVSTYGGGLYRFNKKRNTFSSIPYSSRLTEGLQIDNRGDVWMVCNGHIHKYAPLQNIYSCYNIPALEKNYGLKGYLYRDQQNTIYAGGEGYYITFKPEEVKPIQHRPPIFFTDFKIFDKSYNELLEKEEIRLEHNQNYFAFYFSAPDFSGDNIQYSYQLVGYDKDWIEAGKNNSATYANLPSGFYEFRVQADNWKGGQKESYKSIRVIILSPFWDTWWFWLFVCAVLAVIIYYIYHQRMNVLRERGRIRNEIARDLHDQVGSTLSSIAVYANVAKIYSQKKEERQLTSVLNNIVESANEMVSDMDDIVWALNPKNDDINSITKRWEAYALPLCYASNIEFGLSVDTNTSIIHLGMKERKNLYLIVKEAINNAIKYAQCTQLMVRMYLVNQGLKVTVCDNGIGFDMEVLQMKQKMAFHGNGIANMHVRARDLQGRFSIESSLGKGTVVSVFIDDATSRMRVSKICKKEYENKNCDIRR